MQKPRNVYRRIRSIWRECQGKPRNDQLVELTVYRACSNANCQTLALFYISKSATYFFLVKYISHWKVKAEGTG